MNTRVADLVGRLGGELVGNPDLVVTGIAPLDRADASQLSFITGRKYYDQARASTAAALVLSAADSAALGDGYRGTRILASNPYAWFARAAQVFEALQEHKPAAGIHPSAVIEAGAVVAASAAIGPHVTIEAGARIGEDCVIGSGSFIGRDAIIGAGTRFAPNVSFHARCRIGERGLVHSGAVVGSEGFGHANEGGTWIRIPQTGAVRIGNDVRIGASTTIDRGALDDTVIEDGVKLDNQIQIGHNCHIGAHTAMAGCVGVAGSAKIGRHCTFGGAAMVLGHLSIADHVHVSSGSLVSRSIREPGQYTGFFPLAKNADWEKNAVIVRNLDGMRDKIRELERTLRELQQQQVKKEDL